MSAKAYSCIYQIFSSFLLCAKHSTKKLRILFWVGTNLDAKVDLLNYRFLLVQYFTFTQMSLQNSTLLTVWLIEWQVFIAAFSFLSLFLDCLNTHHKINTLALKSFIKTMHLWKEILWDLWLINSLICLLWLDLNPCRVHRPSWLQGGVRAVLNLSVTTGVHCSLSVPCDPHINNFCSLI